MIIDEQFKQNFIKNYHYAVLMENKTNDDYKKTQQLIEESENIIKKYTKKYDGIISSKDEEINILKNELQDLKTQTKSLRKQLQSIPMSVRKIYNKISF